MKKIIFTIILVVLIIVSLFTYQYYQYQNKIQQQKQINTDYESYLNKEILGTTLISILNKTIDWNNKNGIPQDDKGYFIPNEEQSIKIEIKFKESDNTYQMEQIAKQGSETFVKNYAGMNFKCKELKYHSKTNIVSYLFFEEI